MRHGREKTYFLTLLPVLCWYEGTVPRRTCRRDSACNDLCRIGVGQGAAPTRGDWPKLSQASDNELVKALGHKNGWIRDTAQRLLADRANLSDYALKSLKKAVTAKNELKAIHALWALEGRGELDPETISQGLYHSSEWVRVHAIRAGEPALAGDSIDGELLAAYGASLKDPTFRVRLQAVQSLSVIRNEAMVLESVKQIFHPDLPNDYMEDAIVSSLSGHEIAFANSVLRNARWIQDDGRATVLGKLAGALFEKKADEELLQLVTLLKKKDSSDWKVAALIDGLAKTAGRPEARPIKVGERPKAYYAFIDALPKEFDRKGLAKAFTWPGKVSDNPLDNLNKKQLAFVNAGKDIYTATCMACHQPDGNGMPGLAPALNGSTWVTESKERLALMVFHGVSGPIKVKGEDWNSVMPGHGPMPQFQGEGLAQTLSYIRTAWGNKADIVSDKEIRPILEKQKDRVMPWTVSELEKLGL